LSKETVRDRAGWSHACREWGALDVCLAGCCTGKDLMRTPSSLLRTLVTRPPCGWTGRGPLGVDGAGSL